MGTEGPHPVDEPVLPFHPRPRHGICFSKLSAPMRPCTTLRSIPTKVCGGFLEGGVQVSNGWRSVRRQFSDLVFSLLHDVMLGILGGHVLRSGLTSIQGSAQFRT